MPEEERLSVESRLPAISVVAARAAERGVTLMVQSLEWPHCSIPYPEFADEVAERRRSDNVVPMVSGAEHDLGHSALSQEAELERVPS